MTRALDRVQRRAADAIAFANRGQRRAGINLRPPARGPGSGLSRFKGAKKEPLVVHGGPKSKATLHLPTPPSIPHAKQFGRSKLRRLLIGRELPPVFVGDIRPLALGVWQELYFLCQRGCVQDMRRWLTGYTSRPEYLAACARPNSRRHHVDGTDAGEVSEANRAYAAARLANLQKVAP